MCSDEGNKCIQWHRVVGGQNVKDGRAEDWVTMTTLAIGTYVIRIYVAKLISFPIFLLPVTIYSVIHFRPHFDFWFTVSLDKETHRTR